MDMTTTTNSTMTNYSALIPMGTGIGGLLAWLLPTHCLHPLGILPPFQRAFRQCVGLVQAMVALPGGLMACLVPTDCLRSLENWPPFHRAVRQYVGNPEAIGNLHDNVRQQPDGNCTDFLRWTSQSFLSQLKQFEMATSKGVCSDKVMNHPAYERTRGGP